MPNKINVPDELNGNKAKKYFIFNKLKNVAV